MLIVIRILLAPLALLLVAVPTVYGEDPPKSPKKEYLDQVQSATADLLRAVEQLQNDIAEELASERERTLYKRTDAVLGEVVLFRATVQPGVTRAQLYDAFDRMDKDLHQLLKDVDKLDSDLRSLRRAANRVQIADDELHFVLFTGDTSPERARQILQRQIQALSTAAREMEKAAQYTQTKEPGVPLPAVQQLARATDAFQKRAKSFDQPRQLQKDFKAVNQAWEQTVDVLKRVPPRQNVFLLRSAERLDRLHQRLYQLLGIEGERPRLIIRT